MPIDQPPYGTLGYFGFSDNAIGFNPGLPKLVVTVTHDGKIMREGILLEQLPPETLRQIIVELLEVIKGGKR